MLLLHLYCSIILMNICLGAETNIDPFLSGNEQERYAASGENSERIVAQYVEPVASRDIPTNPLFYGFFYGFNVSDSLHLISEKYLATCYDTIPEFTSFLDRAMYESNITDPFAYYQKPTDPESGRVDPYHHTTAKFCGRHDCVKYWNKAGSYLGREFQMHLVGLFFTRRTFGIRVKLTLEEQSIFEVDERSNSIQAVKESEVHHGEGDKQHNSLGNGGVEYQGYFHDRKLDHPLYPGIKFEPQDMDFHPTESRAHITLGCAPNIQAEQTGLDLLEIIDLEISGHVFHQDLHINAGDIPEATLRQFGGNGDEEELAFVVYPTEKMVTEATFSVYV